ncbi:cyclic nucleotide-binding domain-containing protein [Thiomicrorhabdus sp. Kp2]|uniref:cyclic nucleotide-binding domain-containing protein n=1 Tax=Thiomicrorhabdus sp. Kp2 TaxID=1123518 RepID=UPI0004160247|nr:cyclic nucleotide-binding domain-containing protein [Thiomicrorhabdus sp. Kp2]
MNLDTIVYFAFFIGIISALSLPLGALTTLFWKPGDRTIAWLMAFGAGALLSAVTIDLFSPAIQSGLFIYAAMGSLIGSLSYLMLNHQLNQQGGFLRKTATTIQYFRNRQKKHHHQFIYSLNRLPFFDALPKNELQMLLQKVKIVHYSAEQMIYHHSDIQNQFYIIQKGQIKLRDPNHLLKTFIELDTSDTFGRMAFFTSQPNATLAQAKTDVTLWQISRDSFNELLKQTEVLPKILIQYYQESTEIRRYLKERHQMSDEQLEAHVKFIIELIQNEQRLPETRNPRDTFEEALNRLSSTHRFDLFSNCDSSVLPLIANKLQLRSLRSGQTLFNNRSEADRLYLLESGSIELLDPLKKREDFECLQPGDFFGGMAFVVGGKHASTALAKTDVTFWVLNKFDFIELLANVTPMHAKLQSFLKTRNIQDYLTQEQSLPENKAQQWINRTVKHLLPGQLPSLNEFTQHVYQHKAAYMAIWLGIFLDGIPESLMIGSHLTDGHTLSMSLIAGLFLSNYPEALSSSASMREQGIPFKKVLFAWTLLMLLTGIGAGLGSVLLEGSSPATFAFIGGIAAGAMLTVIAETMLPEAYLKGGSIIGFVTLLGFLSAVLFKVFDSGLAL